MRGTRRFAALLGGLTLAAVAAAACGGGDETESPSTRVPASPTAVTSLTAEERAAAEALLEAATLRLDDLPEGFTLVDESFTTNEETAGEEDADSGQLTTEDLDRLGRILGYEAIYSREASSGTLLLIVTTDVYRDSAGASERFELLRQQPSDPELLEAFQEGSPDSGQDVQDATISPMSIAEVGDDRFAFELKATVQVPDLDTNIDQYARFVHIRRARGIGAVAALAIGSPPPAEELEGLARTFDQRMKDALE